MPSDVEPVTASTGASEVTSASTLDEALARAAAAESLLVATDFDGVLAPFDVDPMAVRPAAGGMESLRALAALPATTVAICPDVISRRSAPWPPSARTSRSC